MIRAVLDTNVLVSAEIKPEGNPNQILRRLDQFEWLTSEYILTELTQVLSRKHIQAKYQKQAAAKAQARYIDLIRAEAIVISVTTEVTAVSKDLKDNPILGCAVDGKAEYVVTGDKHLLELEAYEEIRIVTPSEFLEILSRL